MFRWWIDGDTPKIVCHECGFGYTKDEYIINGEVIECPRCHKKETNDIEILSIQ